MTAILAVNIYLLCLLLLNIITIFSRKKYIDEINISFSLLLFDVILLSFSLLFSRNYPERENAWKGSA